LRRAPSVDFTFVFFNPLYALEIAQFWILARELHAT
jgi:hypothetical protein